MAAPEQETTEQVDDTLTDEDLVAQLLQPEPETKEEAEEQGGEAKSPEAEQEADTEEEEPENTSILDSLSEEEQARLAEEYGSGASRRIAQLIRRAKEAEEKLEQAKSEPEEPFQRKEENPFQSVETMEELGSEAEKLDDFIEWAQDLILDNGDAANDDVIVNQGGDDFTKGEVAKRLRTAKKNRKTHIRARYEELLQAEQAAEQSKAIDSAIAKDYAWSAEEDNPIRQAYEHILANPAVARAVKEFGYLKAVIAEGTQSYIQRNGKPEKKAPAKKAAPKRVTPPGAPGGNAATTSKPADDKAELLQKLKAQADETGDEEDFVRYLTARSS